MRTGSSRAHRVTVGALAHRGSVGSPPAPGASGATLPGPSCTGAALPSAPRASAALPTATARPEAPICGLPLPRLADPAQAATRVCVVTGEPLDAAPIRVLRTEQPAGATRSTRPPCAASPSRSVTPTGLEQEAGETHGCEHDEGGQGTHAFESTRQAHAGMRPFSWRERVPDLLGWGAGVVGIDHPGGRNHGCKMAQTEGGSTRSLRDLPLVAGDLSAYLRGATC